MHDDFQAYVTSPRVNDTNLVEERVKTTQSREQNFRIIKREPFNQLTESAKLLAIAKQEKKEAQMNLQALQVRLTQLKIQDMRSQKKIKEAKLKTYSIIQSKAKSYLDKQMVIHSQHKQQLMDEEKANKIKELRILERQGIESRKQFLSQQRDKEVEFHLKLRQQTQLALGQKQEEIYIENKKLLTNVKIHQQRLDQRKRIIEEQRVKAAELNYREKVQKQLYEAIQTQNELELMTQMEQQATLQLEQTKKLKRSAIDEIKELVTPIVKSNLFRNIQRSLV